MDHIFIEAVNINDTKFPTQNGSYIYRKHAPHFHDPEGVEQLDIKEFIEF